MFRKFPKIFKTSFDAFEPKSINFFLLHMKPGVASDHFNAGKMKNDAFLHQSITNSFREFQWQQHCLNWLCKLKWLQNLWICEMSQRLCHIFKKWFHFMELSISPANSFQKLQSPPFVKSDTYPPYLLSNIPFLAKMPSFSGLEFCN